MTQDGSMNQNTRNKAHKKYSWVKQKSDHQLIKIEVKMFTTSTQKLTKSLNGLQFADFRP